MPGPDCKKKSFVTAAEARIELAKAARNSKPDDEWVPGGYYFHKRPEGCGRYHLRWLHR